MGLLDGFKLSAPSAINPLDVWKGLNNAVSSAAQGVYNAFNPYTAPVLNPNGVPQKAAAPAPATPTPDYAKMYNDSLAAALAAQKASAPPVPRFINFDIGGSWDKARQIATNNANPVYAAMMDRFITRQQTDLANQQADTTSGKSSLDQILSRSLTDSATTRSRTSEDTAANISNINKTQATNAKVEGLSFEQANNSLNSSLSAGNAADTGLGRQQVASVQAARKVASDTDVNNADNAVAAQHTLMNRTFDDLAVKDTRDTQDTGAKKDKLDLDLERFIQKQEMDKADETANEEMAKQKDIASASIGLHGQLVDEWLQTLKGQGYTSQEVANAASMYKT